MSATSIEIRDSATNGRLSSKSNESLYSASSHNSRIRMLQRKSQFRQAGLISASSTGSDVRQRVLSARLHRFKSLQNQLNDALQQNATLKNENRLLKTLSKRQDTALAKYEGSHAELPQLINSHTEELRISQTKNKTLNLQIKELNRKILLKDKVNTELTDRIKHLNRLNDDKNLEEREALTLKLHALEREFAEKDEEIKVLTRRNHLEAKNFKAQLANEKKKNKDLCQKIEQLSIKRYGSSTESDRSCAKDIKHSLVLTTNNTPMPKFMNINRQNSNENRNGKVTASLFLNDLNKKQSQHDIHITDDDTDDEDLIIRTMLEQKPDKTIETNESTQTKQLSRNLSDLSLLVNETMPNLQEIQNQIQSDIEANEKLLDQHCDEISRDIKILARPENATTTTLNGIESILMKEPIHINGMVSHLPKYNGLIENKPIKRTPIDPQKKSKLLAVLKSIDSSDGRQ